MSLCQMIGVRNLWGQLHSFRLLHFCGVSFCMLSGLLMYSMNERRSESWELRCLIRRIWTGDSEGEEFIDAMAEDVENQTICWEDMEQLSVDFEQQSSRAMSKMKIRTQLHKWSSVGNPSLVPSMDFASQQDLRLHLWYPGCKYHCQVHQYTCQMRFHSRP
jgi:hypothetical protein